MAREVEQITSRFFAARRGGRLDLGAAEFEVRAALHKVGSVLLEQLLNGDHGGHSGPRIACGSGHDAEFVDYRSKQVHTILGDVRLRRAYYHCAQCPEDSRRGVIPKDQELDVVGTSFSPGLRRLMARVGAQEP
ncbi:MAG: ISKra4-like element ISDesp4 family transposase, partial [Terriglobales bacterium]